MALQDPIDQRDSEGLPRGRWVDSGGKLIDGVRRYFEKGRIQLGEIISGVNRNAANIVQLETEYQDGDANLQASVDANAAVGAANGTAIATVSNEVQAARDGESSLLAKVNSIDQAVINEGSARATADDSVRAALRSEAFRPNLVPQVYQILNEADAPPLTITGSATGDTSVVNPFSEKDAYRITSDGTSAFITAQMTTSVGATNMVLPPGRYAYKIAIYNETGASINSIRAILRNGLGGIVANNAHAPQVSSFVVQTIEGVWDLSSQTQSDYYLSVEWWLPSAASGVDVWPLRCQVEAIPDSVSGPGEWSGTGLEATAQLLREAFVDTDGNAIATIRLVAAASGGDPATIELLSSDGVSAVRIGGNTQIDGNLVVTGTITAQQIGANEISRAAEVSVTDLDLGDTDNTWINALTMESLDIGAVAILTWDLSVTVTAFGGFGFQDGDVEFEIRRNGVAIGTFSSGFGVDGEPPGTSVENWVSNDFDVTTGTGVVYSVWVRFVIDNDWQTEPSIYSRAITGNLKAVGFQR